MKKIILLLIIIITCGCMDNYEIENTAIVCGMGITYDNNYYTITYEIINSNKDHDSDKQSYILSGYGKNINDAINDINNKSPKKISLKHLEVVLFNSKTNIQELKKYLNSNKNISNNYYLLLVKDNNPLDILEYKDDAYPINSVAIKHILINNNIKKNTISTITLKDKFIIKK